MTTDTIFYTNLIIYGLLVLIVIFLGYIINRTYLSGLSKEDKTLLKEVEKLDKELEVTHEREAETVS